MNINQMILDGSWINVEDIYEAIDTPLEELRTLVGQVLAPGSEEIKKTYYNNNWVKHPPLNSEQWYTNQIWASGEKVYNIPHKNVMQIAKENSTKSWIVDSMNVYKGRLQAWFDVITDQKIEEFFNGAQWSTRNDKAAQLTGHKQFAVTYRKNLNTMMGEVAKLIEEINRPVIELKTLVGNIPGYQSEELRKLKSCYGPAHDGWPAFDFNPNTKSTRTDPNHQWGYMMEQAMKAKNSSIAKNHTQIMKLCRENPLLDIQEPLGQYHNTLDHWGHVFNAYDETAIKDMWTSNTAKVHVANQTKFRNNYLAFINNATLEVGEILKKFTLEGKVEELVREGSREKVNKVFGTIKKLILKDRADRKRFWREALSIGVAFGGLIPVMPSGSYAEGNLDEAVISHHAHLECAKENLSIKEQIHEKEEEHHHSSGFSVSTKPISDAFNLYKNVERAIKLNEKVQIKEDLERQKEEYQKRVLLEAAESMEKSLITQGVLKEEVKERKEEFKEALKDKRIQKAVLNIQRASRLLRRDDASRRMSREEFMKVFEPFEPAFNLFDYKDSFESEPMVSQKLQEQLPGDTLQQRALILLTDAMNSVNAFAKSHPELIKTASMLLDAGSQLLRVGVYTSAVSSGFIAGGPVGAVGAFMFVNAQEEVVAKGFESLCEKGISWAIDQGRNVQESKKFGESVHTFAGLCGAYLAACGVKSYVSRGIKLKAENPIMPRYNEEGVQFSIRVDPKDVTKPMAIDSDLFTSGTLTAGGAKRNHLQFWKMWNEKYPGTLSEKNIAQIYKDGIAPNVDKQWVKHFPEHQKYLDNRLVHHHLEGGNLAVPLPELLHRSEGRTIFHPNNLGGKK